MEESCILTYKKPQKLRLLKSNIPPSQVKSTVILLLPTSTSIYCFRICNIIPPLFVFPENYSFTDNL